MVTIPTTTPVATALPTIVLSPTPLVPAYIPLECDPVTSVATVAPDLNPQDFDNFKNDAITKQQQLRILNEIEKIVDQVYIYPDYHGKDWNAIVSRYRALFQEGVDTDTFYIDIQHMINELEDDHSYFMSPSEVQASDAELRGDNEFVGVGIYSTIDFDRERLVIISTFPGSPAELAGIQSHDSVLFVDGLPITYESGVRTRGPECSAVILTLQSPGEAPHDVILIRSSIEGSVPIDARIVPTTDGSRIGYIFIPSFFDETLPPQIEGALKEFGTLDGLILDVRMNGGGSSTVTYPILSFFMDGLAGSFVSRTDSHELRIDGNPVNNSQTVPLVVMVSEDTASFGEIFAGILRDVRGAKITGETSLGNVEVLHGYDFSDGSYLWIASETFDSAYSDDNWEDTGIVPNIEAFSDWDTFYFETDPSITAALQLLGHK